MNPDTAKENVREEGRREEGRREEGRRGVHVTASTKKYWAASLNWLNVWTKGNAV
jgi:hypothetical protein